jgi:hypothetical protein
VGQRFSTATKETSRGVLATKPVAPEKDKIYCQNEIYCQGFQYYANLVIVKKVKLFCSHAT